MLHRFSSDDMQSVSGPIDDTSLSYVICKLATVSDGKLAFTDYRFSTADECTFVISVYHLVFFP